jgi:hypothetical protein
MNREEAETVALAMQAALNAAGVVPPGCEVVVLVRGHGHVLIAGSGDAQSVGSMLYNATLSFTRALEDGQVEANFREVRTQ